MFSWQPEISCRTANAMSMLLLVSGTLPACPEILLPPYGFRGTVIGCFAFSS